MKYLYLLSSIVLLCIACSKDEFNPSEPKNGEVVELFVDHYSTGADYRVFMKADKNQKLGTYVDNFPGREIGYTYLIKAKVVVAPKGMVDAPAYWFDYMETIHKEKYQGQDTFALPLFGFITPSQSFFLRKEADKYYYGNYLLSAVDDAVNADLEIALEEGQELLETPGYHAITLYVKHDPNNFGKGYLVYQAAF